MKAPSDAIAIRVSIHDHQLVCHTIPPLGTRLLPHCEVMEMSDLPLDVMAWLNILERKKGERQI